MAHIHHCKQCGVAVASCDASLDGHLDCTNQDADGWFCTLHHPAPEHHKDLAQPTKRTVVTLPDARV